MYGIEDAVSEWVTGRGMQHFYKPNRVTIRKSDVSSVEDMGGWCRVTLRCGHQIRVDYDDDPRSIFGCLR